MREYNQLVMPATMMGLSQMGHQNGNMGNNGKYNYTDVIPQNWYKYTRYEVDTGSKRNGVKDGFKKWLDYEKETKEYLNEMSKKLEQSGEREAARKLDYLIDHVEHEIETAEEKMMSLENSGYDMNYILQQQDGLKAKYADKIRKLNAKNNQFRQRGRGNYANYNFSDDDDDEENFEVYRRYPSNRRYYDDY